MVHYYSCKPLNTSKINIYRLIIKKKMLPLLFLISTPFIVKKEKQTKRFSLDLFIFYAPAVKYIAINSPFSSGINSNVFALLKSYSTPFISKYTPIILIPESEFSLTDIFFYIYLHLF